jgi:hypothetical protein
MTDAQLDQCGHDGALLISLVSRKVKLKREGHEWKGLCPFHAEKSTSFTVFSDGHYHCFGCNAHGTAFDFIMATEHVDFPAAINRVETAKGVASSKRKEADGNGADHGEMWQPIVPPPSDAPKPTEVQLRCEMLHEYCAADDRVSGIPGRDDPGFVSAWLAAQLRAPEHPMDREMIVDGLQMLFYSWQRHQPEGDAWEAYRLTIASLCGKIPLTVWSQDLLKRALLTFNTSPPIRELAVVLGAEDARQLGEIETLDCMAKADPHARSGPVRAATEPYNPRAPEWAFRHTVKHRASRDDNDRGVCIDPLADPGQLAALGVETPDTDLSEARRHLFELQRR